MQNSERKMARKIRFYQKHVNRELVENSQHIAHTINTMAVYLYMPGNNTTVRKQPDTSVADLNYILSELKTKIDSLTQQIETMDKSQRLRSQRKTEDPIYQEEVDEEVKENKSASLEALCTKADLLFYGHGVTQDYKKAIDYYKEAAELGFGRACASLGRIYETGNGTNSNLNTAYFYYKRGAECGDLCCIFAVGKYHEKKMIPKNEQSRGMTDAVSYYETAANEDYPEALTKLGYMYEKGIYYNRNQTKALEYYEKAASLGDSLAMNYVGLNLYKNQRYTEAVEMFKKSKELGCARSSNNLGLCYEQGLGVNQDLDQAIACYKESANKKYPQAMFNLGYLYLKKAKTSESIEEFDEAANWLRAAIEEDDKMAEPQFYLGFLFERGLGVSQNLKTAITYYERAYALGYLEAGMNLASLYLDREKECFDEQKGIELMRKAMERGDERAIRFLKNCEEYNREPLNESNINKSKISGNVNKRTNERQISNEIGRASCRERVYAMV